MTLHVRRLMYVTTAIVAWCAIGACNSSPTFHDRTTDRKGPGEDASAPSQIGGSQHRVYGSGDTAILAYPDDGLDDLVATADIIVVARIDSVYAETLGTYGPTPTTDPSIALYGVAPPSSKLPFTYYLLDPENTLLDDGTIEGEEPLLHRRMGKHATTSTEIEIDQGSEFPMGQIDDVYLLFLGELLQDPGYYGLPYGPYGRLILGESDVRFSTGGTQDVPPFAEGMTPNQFLVAVADKISQHQTATPTPEPTTTPGIPPTP